MSWGERLWVFVVVLDPEQVVGLERLGDPDGALGLEVVVDVEKDVDRRADRVTHHRDLLLGVADDLGVGTLVVAQTIAALGDRPRRIARPEDVGLERIVAGLWGLQGGSGDGVPVLQGLIGGERGVTRSRACEVGPVHALAVAVGSADEVVDRDSERLALDVPAGELDAGDAHLRDASGHGTQDAIEVEVELLDRLGVLADNHRLEVFDQPDKRVRGNA